MTSLPLLLTGAKPFLSWSNTPVSAGLLGCQFALPLAAEATTHRKEQQQCYKALECPLVKISDQQNRELSEVIPKIETTGRFLTHITYSLELVTRTTNAMYNILGKG